MNKIIKRVVSAVTAVAIALTAVFVFDVPKMIAAAQAGNLENKGWFLDNDGKLTIANDKGMADWANPSNSPWHSMDVKSVEIQDAVTYIADYTFQNTKIVSITIPNSVTSIGEKAFYDCAYLTSITIPDSVTSIGEKAFNSCVQMSNVTIPASVTQIGKDVFFNTNFTTLTFKGETPPTCGELLYLTKITTISVPCKALSAYQQKLSGYKSKIKAKHGTTKIGEAREPTCTQEGTSGDEICTLCNTIVKYNTIEKKAHDFNTAWLSDASQHWHKCKNCDNIDTKADHSWDNGKETTKPTCTTAGVKTYTCTECQTTKTENISATGHNTKGTIAHKDATCTTDGVKGGTYCTVCNNGKADAQTVIPKTGHNTKGAITHKDATCTTDGVKGGTYCTVCNNGKADAQTVIPKIGHNTDGIIEHKNATCTSTGVIGGTYCTRCYNGKAAAEQTIPMIPHTEVTDPAVAATCTATGLTAGSHCSVCGTITKAQETVTMLPHDWGEYQHNAEQHWQTCQNCVTENNREGHSWDNGTENKPATEYAEGEMLYTCTVCAQIKTEPITKLPHTHKWSDEWTYDENYHWHECTEADLHESEVHGDEIPHDWELSEVLKEATCTEIGTEKYVCTVCGAEKTEEIPIDAEAHDWGSWTILLSPTLETGGTARRVCTRSSDHTDTVDLPVLTDTSVWTNSSHTDPTEDNEGEDVYTSEYGDVPVTLEKLPHTHEWGGWTITLAPTLETEGTAQSVCVKNNEHIRTAVLPVLTDTSVWTKIEHTDPTEDSDGEDVYTSEYGEVPVILPALGHTHEWGNWTITRAPTLEAEGMAKHTCVKNPEHTETKLLPPLTDTSVWTKIDDKHVDPTETTDGRDVYTSEYGEVPVPLDKLPHTHKLTYVPEVPATETTEGVKEHWHCDGCGKDFEDEDGKKELTGEAIKIGKLEVEIQAPANVPQPEIATSKEELIAAALTEEEQKKVEEGTDIKIILKVEDASDSAPAEDKEKINTAIGGLEDHVLGLYLDITLLKKIGEQEEKITRTNALITITFEVPSELRGKAEYTIVRVHDGEITVLSDKDSDPDTITIETDRFSTYALTYREKAAPAPGTGGSGGSSGSGRRPHYSNSAPTEIVSSDDTSDSSDTPPTEDSPDIAAESEPTEDVPETVSSGEIEIPSSEDSYTAPSDESAPASGDESAPAPSADSTTSSSEEPVPSDDTGDREVNPSTGAAVSLIPLAAVAIIIAAAKRKKK